MDLKEEIIAYIQEHKQELLENYSLTTIAIFGSISTGRYTDESDIDLLVDFKPETPNIRGSKNRLKDEFRKKFKREVDVCTRRYLSPYYKQTILSQAISV